MSCSGVPKPPEYYLTTSVLSGVYTPVTVIGNMLMALTILVDPLGEVRTPFNLIHLNAIASDFCFGLLIDIYRAWGNRMRYKGVNVRKVYPDTSYLGMLCHILYFGGQLVAFLSMALMLGDLVVRSGNKNIKVPYSFIVFASICIWALGLGFASLYKVYGYKEVEQIVASVTSFGSFLAIVVILSVLYQPAKKDLARVQPQASIGMADDAPEKDVVVTLEKTESKTSTETEAGKMENGNPDGVAEKIEHAPGKEKQEQSDSTTAAIAARMQKRVANIEALLLYYILLFLFVTASCAIIYADTYDQLNVPCIAKYYLSGWKLMFIVTHKAFNPFLCLLFVPALRRGCLQMLRLRKYRKVTPKP